MPVCKLAPSILAADFSRLGEEVQACSEYADYIHIDVMDGNFVPNISFGAMIVEVCKRVSNLVLDVHLMIDRPERYIADFARAGADIITIHAEATAHVHRGLELIKSHACRAGLALNPLTPLTIYQDALPYLDLALLMTVNPGFGGQKFIPSSLPRIAQLREWIEDVNPNCDLEVDGGISLDTLALVKEAGANVFVAGSAVFNAKASITENLKGLQTLLK